MPTEAQGGHENSAQKGPRWQQGSNSKSSCCQAAVLTTAPLFCAHLVLPNSRLLWFHLQLIHYLGWKIESKLKYTNHKFIVTHEHVTIAFCLTCRSQFSGLSTRYKIFVPCFYAAKATWT